MSLLSPFSIIVASVTISATYFIIDFNWDWSIWIHAGIYDALHVLLAIIHCVIYISGGFMGAGEAIIYVIVTAILYYIIGLGVVFLLREFKGEEDNKMVIGIGVVAQYFITLFITGILEKILSI